MKCLVLPVFFEIFSLTESLNCLEIKSQNISRFLVVGVQGIECCVENSRLRHLLLVMVETDFLLVFVFQVVNSQRVHKVNRRHVPLFAILCATVDTCERIEPLLSDSSASVFPSECWNGGKDII